jgi:isoleucyl-tRNA synthetase
MRKEADYQITDRISIYYIAEGKAKSVLSAGAFKDDVLAVSVVEGEKEGGFTKEVDVNGEKVTLTITKN